MNLAGVLVSAGIGAAVLGGVNSYLINLKAQQTNLGLRTELQEQLKNLRLRTDCTKTLAGINFSSVPTSGQPVVLKSSPSGAEVLPLNGSQKGKFSYVADVFPDRTIQLRAALLLDSLSNPRAAITNTQAKYGQDPVLRQDWTWTFSSNLIANTTPSLATLCQAGGSVLANIGCSSSQVLNGFDANGAPICIALPQGPANQSCPSGQFVSAFNSSGGPICSTPATAQPPAQPPTPPPSTPKPPAWVSVSSYVKTSMSGCFGVPLSQGGPISFYNKVAAGVLQKSGTSSNCDANPTVQGHQAYNYYTQTPDQICVSGGYKSASNQCKCPSCPTTGGTILSNALTSGGHVAIACVYGTNTHNAPTQIWCQ